MSTRTVWEGVRISQGFERVIALRLEPDIHHFDIMSHFVKRMNHGRYFTLFWSVMYAELPIAQEPLPPVRPRGKWSTGDPLKSHLTHLCYPEEPKTFKSAWEYYNESM